MAGALTFLSSPAAIAALTVALGLQAATGFPTWAAFARGRIASTLFPSFAAGALAFAFVQRLTALPAG